MAVNLRKKYFGNKDVSDKRKPYKYQLDYFFEGKRIRDTIKDVEFLPSDSKEVKKQKNAIINKIKADLEIELANKSNGIISRKLRKASFIDYFQSISEKKSPNTKIAWDNTLKYIIQFQGKKLSFENVNEAWLESFSNYLLEKVSQNSARTYLQKISTTLNQAVKQKIIAHNPYHHINTLKKVEKEVVFLEEDEVRKIIQTDFFNNEVKNAFLFGVYTGLRFSDIKALKWGQVKNNRIYLTQTKTQGTVAIPLGPSAKKLLSSQSKETETIFNLSDSNSSVNRTLRKLVEKTGIGKNVHFHSSRHTFATLLISSGTSIYTVSKLLGHKDIKSTLIYAKVLDEEKEKAINKMPIF